MQTHRKAGLQHSLRFMGEALPDASLQERRFEAGLIMTTMSTVGKKVSEQARTRAEVEVWAVAVGEMLCAYLTRYRKFACLGSFECGQVATG